MNNQLKFRAWNKHHKIWVSDFIAINLDGSVYDKDDGGPDDNVVITQYTGEKDHLGKPIFEGDILKNVSFTSRYGRGVLFVVKWGEFEPSDDMGVGGVGFVLPQYYCDFKPEVVGNIFENEELLKSY